MNQLNEHLRAIRTSKAVLLKKMEHCFDIGELISLDSKVNELTKHENELLEQLNAKE